MSPGRAVLLACTVSLAGCVTLSAPAPKIQEYQLDYPPEKGARAALPVVLELGPFRAATAYAGKGIVYRETAHKTGVYLYHWWIAEPAGMVGDLLVRDFAASGSYRAVSHGPAVLRGDYTLSAEIEEIQERLSAGCRACLRLRVLLKRGREDGGDPVLFQRIYAGEEACTTDDTADLVGAMSRALQRISARLQEDVYEAITAAEMAPGHEPTGAPEI